MSVAESLRAGELRHALRTPLNHIIGYCEMLLEDGDSATAAPFRALVSTARELVKHLQNGFQPAREEVSEPEFFALQASLLPFVDRMTGNVEQLFANAPLETENDLAKIRFAVERLRSFATNQPGAVPALSASIPHTPQNGSQGAGGQLLVVDDNADNRDILRRHLERQGYGVATSADGPGALRLLDSGNFDLVLLDVLMPGMDGFEVLQKMKANPALRETPVVMLSALDESNGVIRCIQMGAEDYLAKPFDPVLLRARIGASLEKKHLRDEERLRAQELQQLLDQLRRTQDQLLVQENLASLGALTAGIAHEIKNPAELH